MRDSWDINRTILSQKQCQNPKKNMLTNIENKTMVHRLEMFNILFPQNEKCQESNYRTIVLISHASRAMLEVLQETLYGMRNVWCSKVDSEKEEAPKIILQISAGIGTHQTGTKEDQCTHYIL